VDGELSRTYTIQISSEEIQQMAKALQMIQVLLTGGAGGGAGQEQAKRTGEEVVARGTRKAHQDPSFRSIFTPLVALEGIKQLIANSRVANTYLSSMGKVFGAAIDLLLLPLTPIFNLLLVLLAKLLPHIVAFSEWLRPKVEEFIGWIKEVWKAIKDLDFKKLLGLGKEFFTDPDKAIGGIATLAGLMIGGQLLANAMGLGKAGPLAAGAALFGPVRGLFTAGRGPFPAFGLSWQRLAVGAPLIAGGYLLNNQVQSEWARTLGMLAAGTGIGATVGGVPGALIGGLTAGAIRLGEELPAVGGFFRGVSKFLGFGRQEQPRPVQTVPTGVTTSGGNVTYINTQNINVQVRGESTDRVLREIMNNYDQYLMRQARYG
jgi:hypothetical protein